MGRVSAEPAISVISTQVIDSVTKSGNLKYKLKYKAFIWQANGTSAAGVVGEMPAETVFPVISVTPYIDKSGTSSLRLNMADNKYIAIPKIWTSLVIENRAAVITELINTGLIVIPDKRPRMQMLFDFMGVTDDGLWNVMFKKGDIVTGTIIPSGTGKVTAGVGVVSIPQGSFKWLGVLPPTNTILKTKIASGEATKVPPPIPALPPIPTVENAKAEIAAANPQVVEDIAVEANGSSIPAKKTLFTKKNIIIGSVVLGIIAIAGILKWKKVF